MAKKTVTRNSIQKGYQDFLLDEGKKPESVRIFTKHLGISDEEFFKHFGSLHKIENAIWEDYFLKTLEVIEKDPDFEEMSGREKHLSFLYTLLEIIKPDRSYILMKLEGKKPNNLPKELMEAQKILNQADIYWAKTFEFLPDRAKESTQTVYRRVLWSHAISMLLFWTNDDTGSSKDTDVFVEKSTRTVFDIGELPALDSIFDLSKFFLQRMGFSKN